MSHVSSAHLCHCLEILSNIIVTVLSEFSESLRELGDCLLEKTALNDDEDSGKYVYVFFWNARVCRVGERFFTTSFNAGEVLLMLGKVQYELQKHLDAYVSLFSG